MKRIKNSIKTRHGASSIFLAIILSALILVECTFLNYVWNLDYALSVNTALKTEIDTVLSDYNRQLFDVYGIYAFSIEDVDDYCFNKALEINGLDAKAELYVSSGYTLTAEDLKTAISSYYFYRGSGIAFKGIVEGYSDLLIEMDKRGIFSQVGKFMQSPAAGYLSQMIKGSETAEEWINKAGGLINLEDVLEEAEGLDSIRDDYKEFIRDFGLNIDIDIANWDSLLRSISGLESAVDLLSDNSPDAVKKFFVAHYCAYNFDCWIKPKGDATINGTEFKAIHKDKHSDSEYLITGHNTAGVMELEFITANILICANMLKDFANEKFRNTVEAIAEVISMVIAALTEGAVQINPKLIAVGLTFYIATVQALKDLLTVLGGGRAVIFEYEGQKMITMNYRDFLYLYSLCTPMDKLLSRSLEVLTRDYGTLYKGLKLEADFKGSTYSVDRSYALYDAGEVIT